jgi:hypothetical protein
MMPIALSSAQVPTTIEQITDSGMGCDKSLSLPHLNWRIPLGLEININHLAILIHASPKNMLFAVDLHKDFVNEVSFAIPSVL